MSFLPPCQGTPKIKNVLQTVQQKITILARYIIRERRPSSRAKPCFYLWLSAKNKNRRCPKNNNVDTFLGCISALKIDGKMMVEHPEAAEGAARTHCDSCRAVTGSTQNLNDFSSDDGTVKNHPKPVWARSTICTCRLAGPRQGPFPSWKLFYSLRSRKRHLQLSAKACFEWSEFGQNRSD